MTAKTSPQAARRILLTESDVDAARRLLLVLGGNGKPDPGTTADRQERVGHAQAELQRRHRRLSTIGRPFAAEAPFAILLALYSAEDHEPEMTMSRMTELASIGHATAFRWTSLLHDEGWIIRRADPEDARKVLLRLAAPARRKIDALFAQDYG